MLSMTAWAVSMFLPAIWVGNYSFGAAPQFKGGALLMLGGLGPLMGTMAWYANLPLGVMVLRLLDNRAPHIALSALSGALAASALLGFQMPGFKEGADGGPAHFLAGAWLWLAAFVPPVIASLVEIRRPGRYLV
jgi:hypothetical protein